MRRAPLITMGLSDDGGRAPARDVPAWVAPLRAKWREDAEGRRLRAPRVTDVPSYVVFDRVVAGTTAVTTDPDLDDALGALDALAIQAVAAQVAGLPGGTNLTVAIEVSGDRRHWVAKSTTPEINAVTLSTTATNVVSGADAGATPSLGFVRLRVSLAAVMGIPSAHVRLHVKSRSR